MIAVFKTNVQEPLVAEVIVRELQDLFPGSKINFDLQDCDHILRVDCSADVTAAVISCLQDSGWTCEELE